MSISRKVGLLSLAGILSVGGGFGCGSVSNNDQGTSFLNIGYFTCPADDDDGACTPDELVGSTGQLVALSSVVSAGFDGQLTTVYMGLVNNLETQFIRLNRIDCSYDIPGANSSLSIPDDSTVQGTVIPAVNPTGGDGTDTSTARERAFTSDDDASKVEFAIISPDVHAYLANNQNLLPQLPFRMNASCSATGVTQAGDTLTSNQGLYQIFFVELSEIIPASSGSGGTPPGGASDATSATESATEAVEDSAASTAEEDDEASSESGVTADPFTIRR